MPPTLPVRADAPLDHGRRTLVACVGAIALWPAARAATPPRRLRFSKIDGIAAQDVCEQVMREVYRRLDISLDVVALPGLRALREAASGRMDGEIARIGLVADTEPNLLKVDVAIGMSETTVFTRAPAAAASAPALPGGHRVGIVRGALASKVATQGAQPEELSSMDQLMAALSRRRIDMAVSERLTGICTLDRMGLHEAIVDAPQPLRRLPLYHYLHQRHRALAERVAVTLSAMDRSGELAAVRNAAVTALRARCKHAPAAV